MRRRRVLLRTTRFSAVRVRVRVRMRGDRRSLGSRSPTGRELHCGKFDESDALRNFIQIERSI